MKKACKKSCEKVGGSPTKSLVFTAVFAALCTVSTLLIVLPLPFGYFNTGDVFVLLSGWCLGPVYGAIAAGVGSALADVISGFTLYAPATFIIKSVVAVLAYFVFTFLKGWIKWKKGGFIARAISAAIGELFMMEGYFLYEWVLYGFAGATATLLGNGLQAISCLILATMVIGILYPIKGVRTLFPALSKWDSREK